MFFGSYWDKGKLAYLYFYEKGELVQLSFWPKRQLSSFSCFIKNMTKLVFFWLNMGQESFKVLIKLNYHL